MRVIQLKELLITTLLISFLSAEPGMFPLSDIQNLDLNGAGLELDIDELYNPDGISLVDGICKVGGCSGAFVSPQGLILTNHHCAFGAIRTNSTPEKDYLKDGFLAMTMEDEVPAEGYTVRITESYRNVSADVLSVVTKDMDPAGRTDAIDHQINAIESAAEAENPGMKAEVAEMFLGKSYVLFLYTFLKDVRLVYAPPKSIGNFGGEKDNWMWPRHTADFSFMRAYVAPDGNAADYSQENIPYTPRKVIEIEPEGVEEGDFVFILGYPGRTYRHRTSHYLAYENEVRMPQVADFYEWQIAILKSLGDSDRSVALKLASRIKGLSNTMKNYRGKLQGIRRLELIEKKLDEETALSEFINSKRRLRKKYGTVLPEISSIYEELRYRNEYEFVLRYLKSSSVLLSTGYTIYEKSVEEEKADVDRKSAYTDRNIERTLERMMLKLDNFYLPADEILFQDMLKRYKDLDPEFKVAALDKFSDNGDISAASVSSLLENSVLSDKQYVEKLLTLSAEELGKIDDQVLQLAIELYPVYQEQKQISDRRSGEIDRLHGLLAEVKKAYSPETFIPDANRTLRLTYGHIKGYSPADAKYYSPISTASGVIEKYTGKDPFDLPVGFISLLKSGNFGRYRHKTLGSVPVGILYDMDTTGGNSGSAVLNASGSLVGLNFDRAYEATVNDFAWNKDYSRSIGVDIRYILWIAENYSNAGHLLNEMGVTQN